MSNIPKIIHYCWLSGDPYPEKIRRCIDSWHQIMPDYNYILWDINQINIESNIWLKETVETKKYAFATDYIRFYALYNYGGIYLDTDVEVLKSFDELLSESQFVGYEAGGDIEAAVIGTLPQSKWIKKCMDYYTGRHFILSDGSYDMAPVPLLMNDVIKTESFIIYPFDYFSPKDYNDDKIHQTENTFCIHHFNKQWVEKDFLYFTKKYIHLFLIKLLGRNLHNKIVHRIRIKGSGKK